MTKDSITRERILNAYHTVAIVGLSPDMAKPSNGVGRYLIDHGYNVIPVNPQVPEIMDRTSYANLSAIPEPVEIVDIFRASDKVMPIVEEAIKIKAKAIWMQEGVINEAAAAKARAAGLMVVMDSCIKKDHMRLIHGQEPNDMEDE